MQRGKEQASVGIFLDSEEQGIATSLTSPLPTRSLSVPILPAADSLVAEGSGIHAERVAPQIAESAAL